MSFHSSTRRYSTCALIDHAVDFGFGNHTGTSDEVERPDPASDFCWFWIIQYCCFTAWLSARS